MNLTNLTNSSDISDNAITTIYQNNTIITIKPDYTLYVFTIIFCIMFFAIISMICIRDCISDKNCRCSKCCIKEYHLKDLKPNDQNSFYKPFIKDGIQYQDV